MKLEEIKRAIEELTDSQKREFFPEIVPEICGGSLTKEGRRVIFEKKLSGSRYLESFDELNEIQGKEYLSGGRSSGGILLLSFVITTAALLSFPSQPLYDGASVPEALVSAETGSGVYVAPSWFTAPDSSDGRPDQDDLTAEEAVLRLSSKPEVSNGVQWSSGGG